MTERQKHLMFVHENNCSKFRDLVNRETVKKLEHLVKDA